MAIFQTTKDVPMRLHSLFNRARCPPQRGCIDELRKTEDWCLIVLDACRYDEFSLIFSSFFKGNHRPTWSSGSDTFEYLRTIWDGTYTYPYITGAAPVTPTRLNFGDPNETADGLIFDGESLREKYQGYQPSDHLLNIDAVWQDSWNADLGVCPPEPVTKRAVEAAKNSSKIVAHYFQPHAPFIGERQAIGNKSRFDGLHGGAVTKSIWSKVESGRITDSELRALYRSNLERVLIAVAKLINDTNFGSYVIIGDHGEALGEYGRYGHSLSWHPYVRTVPYAEITDVLESSPPMEEIELKSTNENVSVRDRLTELGYLN